MKNVVYLAGLISTDFPESLQWRIEVTPRLEDAGFKVLSPMRGKSELAKTSKDGGITDDRLTGKDIILRDYGDVCRASVLIMHLENFGSPRPLIGTIAEADWAWQKRIPVVGIAHPDNKVMRTHPFMTEYVAHYVTSVDDAVDLVINHYDR